MIYKVLVKKPEIYKEVVVDDYGEESTVERVRWREEWERVEREMTAEEIAEMEAQQAGMPEPEPAPEPEPTADEVLNALLGVNEE